MASKTGITILQQFPTFPSVDKENNVINLADRIAEYMSEYREAHRGKCLAIEIHKIHSIEVQRIGGSEVEALVEFVEVNRRSDLP